MKGIGRAWRRIGVTRYPISGLLQRIWELRDNISAHDAATWR
jgi:predicted nucleic acid-binding protein